MREKIEQLYIEGMNNDIAPNVFAQTILNLFNENNSNLIKLYSELIDRTDIIIRDKPENFEDKVHELKLITLRVQQLLLEELNSE